ncbi:MAG: hypothetical protein ACLUSL_05790 [Ruminococcus sp.]
MLSISLNPIDQREALRYMGCPEAPDDTLRAVMERCEAQLRKTVHPGVVFRCCPCAGRTAHFPPAVWR